MANSVPRDAVRRREYPYSNWLAVFLGHVVDAEFLVGVDRLTDELLGRLLTQRLEVDLATAQSLSIVMLAVAFALLVAIRTGARS